MTTKGKDLILYSLKNAIEDLENYIKGWQIHRSYWVAEKHIQEISNNNNAENVILTNEYCLPLSRRRAKEIKSKIEHIVN